MSFDTILFWIKKIFTTWGVGTLFAYSLFVTICVTIIILLIARIINHILIKMIKRHYKGQNIVVLLRLKTILIYTIAAYGIFDMILPLKNIMSLLLASGGVLALVIGLATQEAAGNLVNGMMILFFKPFQIGDLIKVNNGELIGTVSDISIRHTIIKTFENTNIIVPNSVMGKAVLENVTAIENHKTNFLELEISYDSDLDLAMQIIEEEAIKHPSFVDIRKQEEIATNTPAVITRVVCFAESGIQLKTLIYSRNNTEGVAMLSDLRIAIKRRFDEANIAFPYPHRTIDLSAETIAHIQKLWQSFDNTENR